MYKKYILSSLLLLSLIVSDAVSALFSDYAYFVGGSISQSSRMSNYQLSKGYEQDIRLEKLVTGGAFIGKRYTLFSEFRLQVPFSFDYGVVAFDTVFDVTFANGADDIVFSNSYFTFSFTPLFQYCIPVTIKSQFFLSGGGGISFTKLKEQAAMAGSSDVKVDYKGLLTDKTVCFSADAGAGFELLLSRWVVAFQYTFKYWKPVKYEYYGDLFPLDGVDYTERFLTHSFQLLFLVRSNN